MYYFIHENKFLLGGTIICIKGHIFSVDQKRTNVFTNNMRKKTGTF
jgi:hypothetical protein